MSAVFTRESTRECMVTFSERERQEQHELRTSHKKKRAHLSGNACSTVGISTPEIAL